MSSHETYVAARGIYVPPRRSSALIASEDLAQFTSRNEDWKKVQQIVISLFQKKSVRGHEILSVSKNLYAIINSPGGKFLKEYYNDFLLIRGIVILREPLRALKGAKFIHELIATWKYFFSEILPSLSAIFYKIGSINMPIRKLTLQTFKDLLLFKLPQLIETFRNDRRSAEMEADLRHMLLILQTATDKSTPDLQLQELLTYVVKPYLCQNGLFMGPGKPVIKPMKSADQEVHQLKKPTEEKSTDTSNSNRNRPLSIHVTRANTDISQTSPSYSRRSVAAISVPEEAPSTPTHARQKSLPDLPLRSLTVKTQETTGSTSSLLSGIPAIEIEWTESASGQLQRDIHAVPQQSMDSCVAPLSPNLAPLSSRATPLSPRVAPHNPRISPLSPGSAMPKIRTDVMTRTARRESVPVTAITIDNAMATNELAGRSGKSHNHHHPLTVGGVSRKALSSAALDTLIECGSGDELALKEQHFV